MPNHDDKLSQLSQKALALPDSPGVYLMKDTKDRVIYIGKARILPNRVATYFQPATNLGSRKQPMIDLIADFDFIQCETEWEALLTENRLIKDLHPRFNARLTDDKTFPYLVITMRDDFPAVYISRSPNDPKYKGAKTLGPFTSPSALRHSIKLLQRPFKFRTCTIDIHDNDPKRRFFRPCLLHAIKQCSAPCAARISKTNYRNDINRFIRFIESKRSVMLRELKHEMDQAASDLEYEKAALLRDQIKALEKLDQRGSKHDNWQPETEIAFIDPRKGAASLQRALKTDREIRCVECIDIAHIQGSETVGSKVCFVDGRPLKNQYRRFRIKTTTNDDYAAINEVVSRAYRHAGQDQALYPDLVIIDGGKGQLTAALDAFQNFDIKPPMVIALAKQNEIIYQQNNSAPIKLSRNHLGLRLCQAIRDEAHRFAQHYHHILRRKKTLEES